MPSHWQARQARKSAPTAALARTQAHLVQGKRIQGGPARASSVITVYIIWDMTSSWLILSYPIHEDINKDKKFGYKGYDRIAFQDLSTFIHAFIHIYPYLYPFSLSMCIFSYPYLSVHSIHAVYPYLSLPIQVFIHVPRFISIFLSIPICSCPYCLSMFIPSYPLWFPLLSFYISSVYQFLSIFNHFVYLFYLFLSMMIIHKYPFVFMFFIQVPVYPSIYILLIHLHSCIPC